MHHQLTTGNQIIFFLEKELCLFGSHQSLFIDGTFAVVKNLKGKFIQCYIISVLYEFDNSTFSYPICFSYMKNRSANSYFELFEFIKKSYFEKFQILLQPKYIRLDCEFATIKSICLSFPNTKIRLCSVHISRNWRKKMVETFGKQFNKNDILLYSWRLIRGTFFLPYESVKILTLYLKNDIIPELEPVVAEKFLYLLENYFGKLYFETNSKFKFEYWNYYNDISELGLFNMTTNAAETINREFKKMVGTGFISYVRAFTLLKEFKELYLAKYHWKIKNSNLNPRTRKTIFREEKLRNLVWSFSSLKELELQNDTLIAQFAYDFTTIDGFSETVITFNSDYEGEIV